MAIKAVVFDIGGVLEITPPTGWDSRWAEKLGMEHDEMVQRMHEVWAGGSIGTIPEEEVERRTAEILGLDEGQLRAFMDDLWEEYLGTLNKELFDYFVGLRPRFKTGILSNSFVGAREREHERYGFGDACDYIVYSHEVGMKKPEWRIYELTCEKLGVEPHEMIFLDDVEQGVEAACEVGIQGIVYRDNAQAIADIEACIAAN